MMDKDDGRVPSAPGSREPRPAVVAASGFDLSREGLPKLRRMARGWLFVRDDGTGYLIDWLWLHGAAIAYATATVKAFLAYHLFLVVGLGRANGLRWRLLPSVGDWAYRDDDGRLASLAHFINAELCRRDSDGEAIAPATQIDGATEGESAGPKDIAQTEQSHDQ